jgi:hypothetical protein
VAVHAGRGEHGRVRAEIECVRRPAVVEARAALQRESDGASHHAQTPNQRVPVGGRSGLIRRHAVDDLADAVRGHQSRDQNGGVGVVQLLVGDFRAVWPDPEKASAVVVEQRREDAGRVEPGAANQSTTPWDETSAAVCRSPIKPWSAMDG